MKAKQTGRTAILIACLLWVLYGCSDKMERYEDPPWLKGTNIENLEKEGRYSIFLQLMERAGYRNTVEKQLTTLFVPDDEAFQLYFQKRGISSIDDLTEDQALELFTLHFLSNPVNANHLVYEKAWSLLESATGEYGALFFRKQTRSISAPYKEIPKYDETYKGKELFIYTNVKYIPLFSIHYFHDYNGNGAEDYPFMYPDSKWGGLINWHNAMIIPPAGNEHTTNIEDLANPTSSGFIYYIDQVVDSMPSIEQYLIGHQDQYGLFYDLMQRFATYTTAGTDLQGRQLYSKGYSDISNIAAERGPNWSSTQTPAYMLDIFTVFLPDNDLLQTYLNNTVLKTYSSLDEVPDVTIRYILQTQITNRLELKSKFTKQYFNYYGDKSVIDISDVDAGYMCSNGVIYKSKRIMEPNVFISVPGPLFINKNYSVFLTMLSNANMIPTLSGEKEVTLFAPNNVQIEAANIRLFLNSSGNLEFQEKADDGQWLVMPEVDLVSYAQDHIYYGNITDLSGEGYLEMASHNYVHYSGQVLTGGLNNYKGVTASVTDGQQRINGMLYFVDNPIQTEYRMGQYIMSDPDLSEFAKLMVEVNMLDTAFIETDTKNQYPNIKITEASNAYYWTAFIPDNAAMAKAKTDGIIPSDADSLLRFVDYHFVQKVICDDGVLSGTFNTLLDGAFLNITNTPNNLRITDASGQEVLLDHANANHLVRRGVVHKITSVLKSK
ncbi:MAG: fasciclin domain-containing protein [Bacteroidales bacterium]|nr:fasciclin domain-containing protein [Bacteroidales bacterium]